MSATSHEPAWTLVSCNYTAYQSCNSTSVTRLHVVETFHSSLRTFYVLCFWRYSPQWARISTFTRFLDHTQRCTTVGRTPLDEWSARCRDLCLTKYNTTNIHAPVVFEPTISATDKTKRKTKNEMAGWRVHGPEKDGNKRIERQSKRSKGLEAYCKGGQDPPRAVAPSKKKKKKKKKNLSRRP